MYKPTIKGRHQLHIKVMGEHINGSSVAAKSTVEKLGSAIESLDETTTPMEIVISQSGELVVTELDGDSL